jgi:hypothetical protein
MAKSQTVEHLLSDAEKVDLQLKIDQLETQIGYYKRQHKAALRELQRERDRLAYLSECREPVKITSIKLPKSKLNEATAVAMYSDTHAEERVDKYKVNKLNEYNPDIYIQRSEKFFVNSLKIIRSLRESNIIKNVVLWLGGDLLTGHIHDELIHTNFMSRTEAQRLVRSQIYSGIDYWRENGEFENIYIKCSFGNHARMTPGRPMIKLLREDSLEWSIYLDIQDRYMKDINDERVDVEVAAGAFLYMDIYGYRIRMTHGEQIKYRKGVGGVTIPAYKMLKDWDAAIHADLTLVAHHHTALDLGRMLFNGSIIGYTEYSQYYGFEPRPPEQTLFLVDAKKQRKSAVFPIWVK